MCTLTYLPTPNGFILTHNRDERMDRPTSKEFQQKKVGSQTLYYPEDLEAHGSWIAFSDTGKAACLLNGGSKTYERKVPYRKSRGLVVLESFEFGSVSEFHEEYDFSDIEPFTLLIKSNQEFCKITHDVDKTSLEFLDPATTHIWSSTTLYTKEVREKRKKWFEQWLSKKPDLNPDNIRAFHNSAGDGDTENDLVMSRWGILKTLSITQISIENHTASLVYQDFVQSSGDKVSVNITA